MPWNNQNDLALDEKHVADYAPGTCGVIYIHNAEQHVYVMGAGNIKASLLGILSGSVPCVLEKAPLWFSYQQTSNMQQAVKLAQDDLAELKPVCN
jgi:hypothetical protein